jgi:acyl carrier protein
MSAEKKTEQDFVKPIAEAVEAAIGKKFDSITLETYLRDDLGLESIDLVDIGFELERIVGIEFDFRQMLLNSDSQAQTGKRIGDLQVAQIARYLLKAYEAQCRRK